MEPSRSKQTEHAYLKRALWMEEHSARELGVADPSPQDVAAFAIESRARWSKSNWRQIKASLIFRYTEMGTQQSAAAVLTLQASSQTACLKKGIHTSAMRKKTITVEEVGALSALIRASRSRYAKTLESWLMLGMEFGLRPHEWCQSRVVWISPSQAIETQAICIEAKAEGLSIELDALPGEPWDATHHPSPDAFEPGESVSQASALSNEPGWHLRVINSKQTNGRSHGACRHLDLSQCNPDLIRQAAMFAKTMSLVHANGLYKPYYEACQRLLHRVNEKMGRKGDKRIQLYSPRHRFASMAKARFTRLEVGALMGHATDKTATGHYGKRRFGVDGGDWVRPLQSEVDRVVPKARVSPAKGARPGRTAKG